MSLGNTNVQSDTKLYILKIKTKKMDPVSNKEVPLMPHLFQVSEKIEDKWTAQPDLIDRFAGDLTKIDFDEGEWKGEKYPIVKLYFKDTVAKETYLLDTSLNNDSRNLANSLLALETFDGLSVSLYKNYSEAKKRDYSNIALFQNNKIVKGKYGRDEMPKADPILDKKGALIKMDTTDIDLFTLEQLKGLAGKLGKTKKTAPKTVQAPVNNPDPADNQGNIDEEVPF